MRVKGVGEADTFSRPVTAPDHTAAVGALMDWIEARSGGDALTAVGHRVVHGGPKYSEPQRITPDMVQELRRLSPFDPEHLPEELLLTEAFQSRFPEPAPGGVLRHGVSPRPATRCPVVADPAPLRSAGRAAVRISRVVVRVSDGRTWPSGRDGSGAGPGHPRPPRQRREPGGGARRQVRRHQHGLHADRRGADEHPLRRSRSRTGLVSGAHRGA